jgi:hypothetical protein
LVVATQHGHELICIPLDSGRADRRLEAAFAFREGFAFFRDLDAATVVDYEVDLDPGMISAESRMCLGTVTWPLLVMVVLISCLWYYPEIYCNTSASQFCAALEKEAFGSLEEGWRNHLMISF